MSLNRRRSSRAGNASDQREECQKCDYRLSQIAKHHKVYYARQVAGCGAHQTHRRSNHNLSTSKQYLDAELLTGGRKRSHHVISETKRSV